MAATATNKKGQSSRRTLKTGTKTEKITTTKTRAYRRGRRDGFSEGCQAALNQAVMDLTRYDTTLDASDVNDMLAVWNLDRVKGLQLYLLAFDCEDNSLIEGAIDGILDGQPLTTRQYNAEAARIRRDWETNGIPKEYWQFVRDYIDGGDEAYVDPRA
jgi:hypothetical protein